MYLNISFTLMIVFSGSLYFCISSINYEKRVCWKSLFPAGAGWIIESCFMWTGLLSYNFSNGDTEMLLVFGAVPCTNIVKFVCIFNNTGSFFVHAEILVCLCTYLKLYIVQLTNIFLHVTANELACNWLVLSWF